MMRKKYPCSELFWSAFGLYTERYEVHLHIKSEFGKIQIRISPNMDTFYVVIFFQIHRWILKYGKIAIEQKQ